MHKPDGYPDVSAYLIVEDARAVLDFCAAVFGAEDLRIIEREGGGIFYHRPWNPDAFPGREALQASPVATNIV